jgi:hypothetical protein
MTLVDFVWMSYLNSNTLSETLLKTRRYGLEAKLAGTELEQQNASNTCLSLRIFRSLQNRCGIFPEIRKG